jgi:hypothetical protein
VSLIAVTNLRGPAATLACPYLHQILPLAGPDNRGLNRIEAAAAGGQGLAGTKHLRRRKGGSNFEHIIFTDALVVIPQFWQ